MTQPERLFLAIDLDDDTRARLQRHLRGRELPGRAVPPEDWHLTLRFLGATDAARRALLEGVLGAAPPGDAFEVVFGALGAFPNPRAAGVVWMGVHDRAGELARLAASMESIARRAGYAPDTRRFTPHLTLARLRPARDVALTLQRSSPAALCMRVDAVHLVRSNPGRTGPRYEIVSSWPLSP